jgi:hypothetical protein
MTKTEQNRVLAWRLKLPREGSAAPRNAEFSAIGAQSRGILR